MELIRKNDPNIGFKYNKYYVGLARNGAPDNYITLRPSKKSALLIDIRLPRNDALTTRIEDADIESLTYNTRSGRYRIKITGRDLTDNAELLAEMIDFARNDAGD